MTRYAAALTGVASLTIMVMLGGRGDGGGNELNLHRNGDGATVVTLADPSRTDPTEFRWVLVNGRSEWCVLVDRETGRVLWCGEKHRPGVRYDSRGIPQLQYGGCVTLQGGLMVVSPRGEAR